jgi:aspartyl-tRNA(Asn)/glutamyl-tRNA(Gln) amidotransferase subunit A
MAIISLPDPRDHMSLPYATLEWSEIEPTALDGLRVSVCRDAGTGLAPTPDVLAVLDDAARALQAAGAEVDATGPLIDDAMLAGLDRFWRMRSVLELKALGPEAAARALPDIRAWASAAERYGAEEVFTGFSMMDAMAVAAAEAMRTCDLLISPVAPIATFSAELAGPIGPERPFDHIGFTVPFSMSGHPAASVPWGVARDGRPIGLQLVGHRHRDLEVLAAARACELLRPPQRPFPVG